MASYAITQLMMETGYQHKTNLFTKKPL